MDIAFLLRRCLACSPTSAQLHAVLYRFCGSRVVQLRALLRTPEWDGRRRDVEREVGAWSRDGKPWVPRLVARLAEIHGRSGGADDLLVHSAACLWLLDQKHTEERLLLNGQIVSLDAVEDGAAALLLAPPEEPIRDWIGEAGQLDRDGKDFGSGLREQLGLRWFVVDPAESELELRHSEISPLVRDELLDRIAEGDLRFGLASPFAGRSFEVRSYPHRSGKVGSVGYEFRALGQAGQDVDDEILEIVAGCRREGVDVLILPELTVDSDCLACLQRTLATQNLDLQPALVIAGSFHEAKRNRCRVLDGRGNELLIQEKQIAYRLPKEQIPGLPPPLRKALGLVKGKDWHEDIQPATCLHVVDSPLGRFVVAICVDYVGDPLGRLVPECGVNLLFVPAMTPSIEPFHERARHFGQRSRASSFAVNSDWLLRQMDPKVQQENKLAAFAYVPRRGGLTTQFEASTRSPSLRVFSIRELAGG